jgi:oligopeptide transport system ATP-binding protein
VTAAADSPAGLEVRDVRKAFPLGTPLDRLLGRDRGALVAVDGVSFRVAPGDSLGIVGESGSGKSVLAELILRLQDPTAGEIRYRGTAVSGLTGTDLLAYRRAVQIVFQNPYDALNPSARLRESLIEPLKVHRACDPSEYDERARAGLDEVGLRPAATYLERYPHQLSGGEVQRAAIARALMLGPSLIVADEPTSMLDVSVRAGVLNLLRELRASRQLTLVFISHDFSTIRYIATWTAVMQAGEIVEIGPTKEVIGRRLHPYTHALVSAVPIPGDGLKRRRVLLKGPRHDPTSTAPGCRYAGRCPRKQPVCDAERPRLRELRPGHSVACHLVDPRQLSEDVR